MADEQVARAGSFPTRRSLREAERRAAAVAAEQTAAPAPATTVADGPLGRVGFAAAESPVARPARSVGQAPFAPAAAAPAPRAVMAGPVPTTPIAAPARPAPVASLAAAPARPTWVPSVASSTLPVATATVPAPAVAAPVAPAPGAAAAAAPVQVTPNPVAPVLAAPNPAGPVLAAPNAAAPVLVAPTPVAPTEAVPLAAAATTAAPQPRAVAAASSARAAEAAEAGTAHTPREALRPRASAPATSPAVTTPAAATRPAAARRRRPTRAVAKFGVLGSLASVTVVVPLAQGLVHSAAAQDGPAIAGGALPSTVTALTGSVLGAEPPASLVVPAGTVAVRDTTTVSRDLTRTTLANCTGLVPDAKTATNGHVPERDLCTLWDGHTKVRADAAVALAQLNDAYVARFGRNLCLASGYRSLAAQYAVKATRGYLAANPGTSNHGWGLAIDLCSGDTHGAPWTWINENAPVYGWKHPLWALPSGVGPHEPWHWEYAAGVEADGENPGY